MYAMVGAEGMSLCARFCRFRPERRGTEISSRDEIGADRGEFRVDGRRPRAENAATHDDTIVIGRGEPSGSGNVQQTPSRERDTERELKRRADHGLRPAEEASGHTPADA